MPASPSSLTLFIPGRPEPQGSKSIGQYGQIYEQGSKKLKPWRDAVRIYSRSAGVMLEGAIDLYLDFRFMRPPSHLRASGKLRKSAPQMHVFKPDVDKLTRAVLDALTGEIFADDRQVVSVHASKFWTEDPNLEGVQIIAVEVRSVSEVLPLEDILDQ